MVTALTCTSGIVTVWHVLVAWLQYWQLQYTKRAPLVNSSDVGPMTRLSVDTSDHRDVRTVTWNHGYDGLWSESHVSFVATTVRCLPVHLSHRCLPVHLYHRCLPIHLSHRKRPHLLNTHRLPSVQRHFEHRVQRWHHFHHHYNSKLTPPPAPPATTSSASVSPVCQFGVDRKRSNQTHPPPPPPPLKDAVHPLPPTTHTVS